MILTIVLLAIIVIQVFVIGVLIDNYNQLEKDNKRYFNKLRREYDIKIDELKQDISVRDEIIEGRKLVG